MTSTESFKASDIVAHFNQLKSTGVENWWSNYVSFQWTRIRSGKNSTKWLTLQYTPNLSIKPKRLSVIIRDEVHSGQIMPSTAEEVIEMKSKFPDAKIEIRTMKPSLQFQKWSKQVPTQEDRITPIIDENGKVVVPEDKYLSNYYQVAYYIDEIFKYEMKQRTDRGSFLMLYLNQNKNATAKELREKIGHVNECDTIMCDYDANIIRDKYPDKYVDLMKGVLTVSNIKISTIIQERISDKAVNNKGAKLPNPMTRITIPFDPKISTPPMVTILDKSKPFKYNGKKGYENATYNDKPIDSTNIHLFVQSRSIVDGIINMDSVCFSQLGISLPVKASLLIIQPPIKRENNVLNICTEIYGDDFDETESTYTVKTISESSTNKEPDTTLDSLITDLSV